MLPHTGPRVRRTCAALLGALLLLIVAGAGRDPQAEPLPSDRDFQDMFQARQYQACLQQIARVLRLKGDAVARYDRFELLLLRGECLLQLHDQGSAQRAFDEAQRSPDPSLALRAHGLLVLTRATRDLVYAPPDASSPIDVVPPEGRAKAAAIHFNAIYQASKQEIKSAQTAQNLSQLTAVLPKVVDLEGLATLAEGADEPLKPAVGKLGQRTRELLAREVQSLEYKTDDVHHRTRDVPGVAVVPGSPWWMANIRRGLSTPDRRTLHLIVDQAKSLARSAEYGRMLAQAFMGDADAWQTLADRAEAAARRAQDLLDGG